MGADPKASEDLASFELESLHYYACSSGTPTQEFVRDKIVRACAEIRRTRATANMDCIEPRRPFRPDKLRVDRNDWMRASGLAVCTTCELLYADHASVRGYEWLTRLCDGRLVKL